MSSGVSDQMKVPGNAAKNIDDRSIAWTQVNEEPTYEKQSSLNDNSAVSQNSSMQFQFPPFNAKDAHPSSSNNYKPRRSGGQSNYDSIKKYNKAGQNKRDDYQHNAWGSNNYRRFSAGNSTGNYNRGPRDDDFRNDSYSSVKLDNRPNLNDEKKIVSSSTAPKKTTWASIASQPAKLSSRSTLATSSQKKKGPGMPPPPMVPGKHNLDANIWDLPNSNPPPVPSPPPALDLGSNDINSDFPPGIEANFEMPSRFDNDGLNKIHDFEAEESNKGNCNNNYGRSVDSQKRNSRKCWMPHISIYQHGSRQPEHMRGVDAAGCGDGRNSNSSGVGRYGERKGPCSSLRQDFNIGSYEYRDNNSSTSVSASAGTSGLISADTIERAVESPQAVLEELRDKNNYNPEAIDMDMATSARFFVIKSYSEDDVHRSIKYDIWCSTDHGNKRLDDAFKERNKDGGKILLFFSVNGSGHFCGMAQMMTPVDYNSTSNVWSQDKWKGKFKVKWIYVKDVPNSQLRHITLENNENKPVTNSRDTQEVPYTKGIEVLKIFHSYKHGTSIFDDFYHYEKKQEQEGSSKKTLSGFDGPPTSKTHFNTRQNDDRDGRGSGSLAQSKQFGIGPSFRERNNSYRGGGGYNSYPDYRRFDSHRSGDRKNDRGDRNDQGDFRDIDGNRENIEYNNSIRNIPKYEYNRRDDRMTSKYTSRDQQFLEDIHLKNDVGRLRSGPRENQQVNDNEQNSPDRVRGNDY